MQELSSDANGIAEAGITMYNTSPKYGNKKYGAVDSNGGSFVELEVDWSKAPDITGFMHCHLNNLNVIKTYTVFSMSDFIALAQLVENFTAPVHTLGMYVTTNRGTFAIKLTNKQAIIDFSDYIKNNIEYVDTFYFSKIKPNASKRQQSSGLLSLIKESNVGTGIELYESDSNFKNWKKLYLDENNDLKTANCN
ncbi:MULTISPECIES: hypothetical protein [Chryseobacterium]|uniref:Uncharacterized protein n=1 Tax=Chryseobacterium taihuense TaxID=1141221 RepID=A0A4U8WAW9_9FLAO|nr:MULTISPECIES: hypothetical protein [Chryseobacterium]QQV03226.1 hypothetical protein I6I61_02370 [Chryseobacterium sp. FDAARGOS 1104]VFB03467.1 Uncharacterised protein [Chryseobacterium taihuense]